MNAQPAFVPVYQNFDRGTFSVWIEKHHKGWQAGVLSPGHRGPGLGGIVRATPIAAMRAAIRLAHLCHVAAVRDVKGAGR